MPVQGKFATKTTVTPKASRDEIERTLARYGATAFSFGQDGERSTLMFRAQDRVVRFDVDTPALADFRLTPGGRVRATGDQRSARDQAERQRWRALALLVKARLEGVEAGLENFEKAFMPYVLLPDGSSVGDHVAPALAAAYDTGEMPRLLP